MIRPHVLRRHRSARSLVRESLAKQLAEMDEDDVRMPAHPSHKGDGAFTYKEMLAAIKGQRMWAFVRIPNKGSAKAVIHYWADSTVTDEELADMLGHELGHITGEILDDDADEERRADQFGAVAREVVAQLSRKRRS